MDVLDWLTLVSYIALNVDILLETKKIYKTKSSEDLSLFGMAIRGIALLIILIKLISLDDQSLIFGQALMNVTFLAYFALAVSFYKHGKKKKKR